MDYEQKYNEALERAKKVNECKADDREPGTSLCEYIFPELKESEDERIKKEIIQYIKTGTYHKDWIAWLEKQGTKEVDPRYENLEKLLVADNIYQMSMNETMVEEAKSKAINALSELEISKLLGIEKQGEQKPFDYEHANIQQKDFVPKVTPKIGPKFKVGDWLQYRNAKPFFVEEITKQGYVNGDSCLPFNWENEIHLWTVQDAKPGDVLVHNDVIFIFTGIENGIVTGFEENFVCGEIPACFGEAYKYNDYHPANKIERNILFQNMKESGYEWDVEKKELRVVEDEPENYKKQIMSEMADLIIDYIRQNKTKGSEQ